MTRSAVARFGTSGFAASASCADAIDHARAAAIVKEQQFQEAIDTALGIDFQAISSVPGRIVPGQRVTVDVSLTNRGSVTSRTLVWSLSRLHAGSLWESPLAIYGWARIARSVRR
jgi:hypothetical protein